MSGLLDTFGEFNKKTTNAITGGGPEQSYLGGSKESLDQRRTDLRGIGQGANQAGAQNVEAGVGTLGMAGQQAQGDRTAAYGMMGQGQAMGDRGLRNQQDAIATARNYGWRDTGSQALIQQQQGLDRVQGSMMAQAAAARGGNQAAAMRNAQAQGSAMGLQVNQQAALIRAQEEQAKVNRQIAIEQMAAQAGQQQAGMGYGMQAQGLGYGLQSTGQLGQLGSQQANIGLGQQNVGLGAYGLLNDADKTQLEADRANASARAVAGNSVATFGSLLGGVTQLWGGGGQG